MQETKARIKSEANVSPREAAWILGIRLDSVYSLIWAGRLQAEKKDGRWLVDREAVDAKVRKRTAKRSMSHNELPLEKRSENLARDARLNTCHSALAKEA